MKGRPFVLILMIWASGAMAGPARSILIPAGSYKTFFKDTDADLVSIAPFKMDVAPVTNADFDEFLKSHSRFLKSQVSRLFADVRYLQHWKSDRLSDDEIQKIGNKPVTFVSWFAAREYCASKGERLANIDEWEYASDAANPIEQEKIFRWYEKTQESLPGFIGQSKPNRFGVQDMHGLIWEWVEDFNSVMISSDSRTKGERTVGFFCGGGSVNAKDASQYATFMRFAFRSGLKGNYTTQNLGFRCAGGGGK